MTLHVQEVAIPSHGIETRDSWQVVPERDSGRRKVEMSGMRKSLYWLTFGVNSSISYQPGARDPYSQEIEEVTEQQQFTTDLQATLALYGERFAVTLPDETMSDTDRTMTVIGTYTDKARGKAAIIIRHTGHSQQIEHTWISQ